MTEPVKQPEVDNEDEVVAEDTTEEVDVEEEEEDVPVVEDTTDTDENPTQKSPYRY